MFQMLTIGGVKRHERTAHMNPLTPGGIPLKIEGVSKIFPGRTGVVGIASCECRGAGR